jgi:hypothetical protein
MNLEKSYFVFAPQDQLIGPLTLEQLSDGLSTGKFLFTDYVCNPANEQKWIRLYELPDFAGFVQKKPDHALYLRALKVAAGDKIELDPSSTKHNIPRVPQRPTGLQPWYLQYEGSEFGPLAEAEVIKVIQKGKLKGTLCAWKPGQAEWKSVYEVPELKELLTQMRILMPTLAPEQRVKDRVAFMATVHFALLNKANATPSFAHVGICRDISVGGMLVFHRGLTVKNGDILQVRVNTTSTDVPSFEALAEVRFLYKENEGFGISFKKLPTEIKAAIASLVKIQTAQDRKPSGLKIEK